MKILEEVQKIWKKIWINFGILSRIFWKVFKKFLINLSLAEFEQILCKIRKNFNYE